MLTGGNSVFLEKWKNNKCYSFFSQGGEETPRVQPASEGEEPPAEPEASQEDQGERGGQGPAKFATGTATFPIKILHTRLTYQYLGTLFRSDISKRHSFRGYKVVPITKTVTITITIAITVTATTTATATCAVTGYGLYQNILFSKTGRALGLYPPAGEAPDRGVDAGLFVLVFGPRGGGRAEDGGGRGRPFGLAGGVVFQEEEGGAGLGGGGGAGGKEKTTVYFVEQTVFCYLDFPPPLIHPV